jgi:protein-L-isoaspartate(D-aspartate) O-methyltransferase
MLPDHLFDVDASREDLIRSLKREGILKSQIVEDAIRSVPREKFLWKGTPEFLAYADEPQGLGDTLQTISAPHMVVMMLEELELSRALKVLEIGTGSGYNAALIGWIVSRRASRVEEELVISIERDSRLASFSRENIRSVGLSKVVKVVEGDGSLGYPQGSKEEIYDRIIVTAGAPHVPVFLKSQLKTGGIMLIPIGGSHYQDLVRLEKNKKQGNKEYFEEEKVVQCMFVPLIGQEGFGSNVS